jgi:Fe(3+) dicitrate transport protein
MLRPDSAVIVFFAAFACAPWSARAETPPPEPPPAETPAPEQEPEPKPKPEPKPEAKPEPESEPKPEPEPEPEEPETTEAEPEPEAPPDTVIRQNRRDLFRTPGSAHLLDEDELESTNYNDPHAALAPVPGVYVRTEDGFGLRPNIGIRGANAERSQKVTLMEDGILFGPAPYSAPAAYYFPLMTRMTGLEVTKGPGAVLYGPQTIGGAINLFTRNVPRRLAAGIDLSLGSAANFGQNANFSGHAWGGTGFSRGGVLLEAVHLENSGFKELDGGHPDGFDGTGFSRTELMAKARLFNDPDARVGHRVDLKLGFAREISHETYLGLSDADFKDNPWRRYAASAMDRMAWDRFQVELSHALTVDAFELNSAAYLHTLDRTWNRLNGFRDGPALDTLMFDPDSAANNVFFRILTGQDDSSVPGEALMIARNARSFMVAGVQTVARYRALTGAWRHKVEAGARLHHDMVERHHTQTAWLMQDGTLQREDSPRETTLRNEGSALALALHAIYGLSGHGLTVTPGVRSELIWNGYSETGRVSDLATSQAVLLPGLGVHYAFLPEFGAFAGVHRGFSPVAPGQSNDVRSETSIAWEAGLRYWDEDLGSLAEVVFFFNDYDNLTGTCTMSSGCRDDDIDRQFNAGRVHVKGIELTAGHTFDLGCGWKMPAKLAWTWTDGAFQTAFNSGNPQFGNVRAGYELPYVPPHQLTAQLGLSRGPASLLAVYGFTAPMLEVAGTRDGREPETDPIHMLDVIGSWALSEQWQIYVRGENVLMETPIGARRPFGARPVRPFMAQLGVRWTL